VVLRYIKKKPGNLTLVNSSETIQHKRSAGEDGRAASSGQSSPLLSPFRTSSATTCRSPAEVLADRKGADQVIFFCLIALVARCAVCVEAYLSICLSYLFTVA